MLHGQVGCNQSPQPFSRVPVGRGRITRGPLVPARVGGREGADASLLHQAETGMRVQGGVSPQEGKGVVRIFCLFFQEASYLGPREFYQRAGFYKAVRDKGVTEVW